MIRESALTRVVRERSFRLTARQKVTKKKKKKGELDRNREALIKIICKRLAQRYWIIIGRRIVSDVVQVHNTKPSVCADYTWGALIKSDDSRENNTLYANYGVNNVLRQYFPVD